MLAMAEIIQTIWSMASTKYYFASLFFFFFISNVTMGPISPYIITTIIFLIFCWWQNVTNFQHERIDSCSDILASTKKNHLMMNSLYIILYLQTCTPAHIFSFAESVVCTEFAFLSLLKTFLHKITLICWQCFVIKRTFFMVANYYLSRQLFKNINICGDYFVQET